MQGPLSCLLAGAEARPRGSSTQAQQLLFSSRPIASYQLDRGRERLGHPRLLSLDCLPHSLQSYFANPPALPGLGLQPPRPSKPRPGNVLISCLGKRGKVSVTHSPSQEHMTALFRAATPGPKLSMRRARLHTAGLQGHPRLSRGIAHPLQL